MCLPSPKPPPPPPPPPPPVVLPPTPTPTDATAVRAEAEQNNRLRIGSQRDRAPAKRSLRIKRARHGRQPSQGAVTSNAGGVGIQT